MRRVRDLELNRLSVSSDSTFSAALTLMAGSGQSAVAVVDDGKFLGVVTIEAAILSDAEATVKEAMQGRRLDLSPDQPVRDAAKDFVGSQSAVAAVFDGDQFLGLLSPLGLLIELGRSWDPMTGLSWSDALREWGVSQLEADNEITVVLFDIDDFGRFNKKHGHIFGDRVVCALADHLKTSIDPERDVLVRYAGDEFVIATRRNRADTEAFVQGLLRKPLVVKGLDERVTFSHGIAGGKRGRSPSRTDESSHLHAQSTLDNLINLASKAMTENKSVKKGAVTKGLPEGLRVMVESTEPAVATVEAVRDGTTGVGTAFKGRGPMAMAVARATVEAVVGASGARVRVDDVFFHLDADDAKHVTVVGRWDDAGEERSLAGTVGSEGDPDLSVARATLAALSPVTAATAKGNRN